MENGVNDYATEGWLLKWTTYLKGYRKRYFVLENGLLSYYSQPEMKFIACRSTINLSQALILFPKHCSYFIISEGSRRYYLKCIDPSEKARWQKALHQSKPDLRKMSIINGNSDSMSSDTQKYRKNTSIEERYSSLYNAESKRTKKNKRSKAAHKASNSSDRINEDIYESRKQANFQVESRVDSSNFISEMSASNIPHVVNGRANSTCTNHMSYPRRKGGAEHGHNWLGGLRMLNCINNRAHNNNESFKRIHGSEPMINRKQMSSDPEVFRTGCANATSSYEYQNEVWDHEYRELSKDIFQLNEEGSRFNQTMNNLLKSLQNPNDKTKIIASKSIENIQKVNQAFIDQTSEILTKWSEKIQKLHKKLAEELKNKEKLEKVIEQLARQHTLLETQMANKSDSIYEKNVKSSVAISTKARLKSVSSGLSISTENDTFYDAQSLRESLLYPDNFILDRNNIVNASQSSIDSIIRTDKMQDSETESEDMDHLEINLLVNNKKPTQKSSLDQNQSDLKNLKNRRTTIPPKPRYSLNLWSVLKNSIGKELTKLPLPVNFNEPLSVLQRATEDLLYSNLLDKASEYGERGDAVMQMAYVAAFMASSYASTLDRTGKPFNPMLGETYECDRLNELNQEWRSFSEQVSHHPPIMAFYAESLKRKWLFRQHLTINSKFRGKYLSVTPNGAVSLKFGDGNVYIWNKLTTTVHNIIVGRLWIDNHGESEIINKTNGFICNIVGHPHSYFTSQNRCITGNIMNAEGSHVYSLKGSWDKALYGFHPDHPKEEECLWVANSPRPDAYEIYNFNDMSVQLNEMEDGIAPTDSRHRPDQRLMEEGKWNEANIVKEQLEQNQRERRKLWEKNDYSKGKPYVPLWFKKMNDPETGQECYEFQGEYWKRKQTGDWSECPKIFER